MEKLITVVGVGPGGQEYLLPAAEKAINDADIIVGGERLLHSYASENKQTYSIKNNLKEVVSFIKGKTNEGKVAVLASGDPGMYGILNFLLKHFAPEELEVIPGISSVQLACARLKISWHDGVITSVHGREPQKLVELVKNNEKVMVLTDHISTPAVIAKLLVNSGVAAKTAYVCQNLSYENEVVKGFSLEELQNSPGYPGSVLVIVDE